MKHHIYYQEVSEDLKTIIVRKMGRSHPARKSLMMLVCALRSEVCIVLTVVEFDVSYDSYAF